jgi:hypothetical protein
MKRKTRWLLGVVGALVLGFGLACLNYTKADALDHHRAVAQRHHLPPPSATILYGGVLAVVLGAATVGFVLGAATAGPARPDSADSGSAGSPRRE